MLTGALEQRRRNRLLSGLGAVILIGLGSRLVHTGFPFLDKYLGDTLYAVMVYLILALCRCCATPLRRGILTMTIMTALELLQLTGLPLAMTGSGSLGLKIVGRLLGTVFGWLDLVAYAVGIAVVLCTEYCLRKEETE